MTYTLASFSGGKDSTAMVLRMLEIGDPLDEVIFNDTGMEFPAMYAHIDKVSEYIQDSGVKFTKLKADKSFEWYFAEKPIASKKHGNYLGYSWQELEDRFAREDLYNDSQKKIEDWIIPVLSE